MGNNQSRFSFHDNSVLKPPSYLPKLVNLYQKNNQNNNFTLHQTSQTQKNLTLRKYIAITKLTQSQHEIFEWRKKTKAPIVKVQYIELLRSTQKLQYNQDVQIHVYCDHIIKCLADMYNLRLDESIYVFRECLLGYQALLSKLSKVAINKFYCGINVQGKLKTWINKNLSENTCQLHSNIRQTHGHVFTDESSVISKIIHMVSLIANIQQTKYFFYGLEKQLKLKGFTFNNCHEYISNFVINSKITIPDLLQRYLTKNKTFSGIQISRASRRPSHIQPSSRSSTKKNSLGSLHLKENNSNYLKVNDKVVLQKSKSRGRYTLFERKSPNLLEDTNHDKKIKTETQSNQISEVSLQQIMERSMHNSTKSNQVLTKKCSNIIIKKEHRPSISIIPSFLTQSIKDKANKNGSKSKDQSCNMSNNSNTSQDKISKKFTKNAQISQSNPRFRSSSISQQLKNSNTNSSANTQNMYNHCKQHDKGAIFNNKGSFLNTRTTTSENQQKINSSSLSHQSFVNKNSSSRIRKGSGETPNPKRESNHQQPKRSLISLKYTFQQIIESNSYKEVQDEPQVKEFIEASFRQIPVEKPKLRINRKQSDSQQQIIKLKQKTEQVLYQNQWTRTINNLPLGKCSSKNLQQSIIQGPQQTSNIMDGVRLQKLQKYGREVCFSIIPETQ